MAEKRARKRKQAAVPEGASLRWLEVHRFRHVEPCKLHFNEGYNVLLGLNGTGKTTLLELIAAALRFDFSKLKKEAFSFEYELGLPEGTLRVAVRNEETRRPNAGGQLELLAVPSLRPGFEVLLSDAAGIRRFWVRADESGVKVELEGRPQDSGADRADVLYEPRFLDAVASHWAYADRTTWGILARELGRLQLNRRFDESLGFLRVITGAHSGVEIVGMSDRASPLGVLSRGPLPTSILLALGDFRRDAEPTLTLASENVEVLARIAKMLGFSRVELRLSHIKTEVKDGLQRRHYGDLRFMLERADGSVISHKLLSYGQKRALSFLCYLDANPAAVIADELVDGLHHLWIVDAIQAIGRRQAFLASQNPLLLDYLEFDSAEKVRQSFVQCRLRQDDTGRERMIWANMSEYDAGRFFEAYQVGLQHVSEILRTKGLW